jgi:DNA end-binding protein Ku
LLRREVRERFPEHARRAAVKQVSAKEAMTMAARANWKGVLRIGELSCSVALYTAASTAERIAFHILNRKTGHRVHREFVDAETGEVVEAKEQVKGYETGAGDYIPFEPEEMRLRPSCRATRLMIFISTGRITSRLPTPPPPMRSR